MKNRCVLAILAALLLTGCWDKVELEKRSFVLSVGIDKFNGGENSEFEKADEKKRFTVTASIPNVAALSGQSSGGNQKTEAVKTSSNETVSAAMRIIDAYSSKRLYYGQTKLVTLGSKMLSDPDLFREALDALERNEELSRKLIILSTEGEARKILNAEIPGEPMVGMYVANSYKNNLNTVGMAFKQDLEAVIQALRATGNAVLPKVTLEERKSEYGENLDNDGDKDKEDKKEVKKEDKDKDEDNKKNVEVKLGGAAVIKDFKLAGWLNDEEVRGYLWLKSEARGSQVIAKLENTYIPLRVKNVKSKLSFYENSSGEGIICHAEVKVNGVLEEYILSNQSLSSDEKTSVLKQEYEQIIKAEIQKTFDKFKNEYKVDGYNFKDELRKKSHGIYQKYGGNPTEALSRIEMDANVEVKITGFGAVK